MGETCNKSGVSRRTVLIAAAGAAPLLALSSGQAQAKMAPASVKYQTTPNNGHQCSECNFFIAPSSCQLVDGVIAPTGWCQMWAKKA